MTARTVADEVYGCSTEVSIAATYTLALPNRKGGCRMFSIEPTVASLNAVLPDARSIGRTGSGIYTVYNTGAHTLTIKASDGTTTVGTVLAGRIVELSLIADDTANGEWLVESYATVGVGTTMTVARQPFRLDIVNSGTRTLNLRAQCDRLGYTGEDALALYVEIAEGVTRGSPGGSLQAIDTGTFAAGTTILLVNRGIVTGHGGNGGQGGTAASGAGVAGGTGGDALVARHDISIVNYGTFAGGGGGGGGGQGDAADGGGGGGGGAGSIPGRGGAVVTSLAIAGLNGTNSFGGGGGAGGPGASAGGGGGSLGSNGTAGSGGSGGAAGVTGHCLRAIGTGVVITVIRTGTLSGTQDLS